MVNPWFPPHGASAPSPPRFTSVPPPLPPDPPDPGDPLSLSRFPPLGSPSSKPVRSSLQTAKSQGPVAKSPLSKTTGVVSSDGSALESTVDPRSVFFRSGNTVLFDHGNLKVLPPKYSSPIQTNKASCASLPPTGLPRQPLPPSSSNPTSKLCSQTIPPQTVSLFPTPRNLLLIIPPPNPPPATSFCPAASKSNCQT
ncbi:LOW QUALITY PROTEIN: hypothetical protein Bca4012_036302 [Brassica carinata]